MARAYSQDLRVRVLDAVARGLSARQAAAHYGVGVTTAIVWARRARDSGETTARRQGQPRGSKLDGYAEVLLGFVAAKPDITLREMRQRLADEHGVRAGVGTFWRFFAAQDWTFKN